MANTATLQSLRDRVAANADTPITANGFGAIAQVNQWLNDGLQEIHYLLANSGEDYFNATPQSITLNGAASYALNSDFYKAKGVDYVVGSDSFDVPRISPGERNIYQRRTVQPADFGYRVLGPSITFVPPPSTGLVRVNYVPQFAKLTVDGNLVHSSVPEGWEAYAVAVATAKLLAKEESDNTVWLAEQKRLMAMMVAFFEPRDQVEPMRIVDAYGRFNRGGGDRDWSR